MKVITNTLHIGVCTASDLVTAFIDEFEWVITQIGLS